MKLVTICLAVLTLCACQPKPMSPKDMAAKIKECRELGLKPVELEYLFAPGVIGGIECVMPHAGGPQP